MPLRCEIVSVEIPLQICLCLSLVTDSSMVVVSRSVPPVRAYGRAYRQHGGAQPSPKEGELRLEGTFRGRLWD
jgi:hypothetical protein